MDVVHGILFNMVGLYSLLLGLYAVVLAARKEQLSGNFWGAIAVFAILALVTGIVGIVLILSGYTTVDGRLFVYVLYMAWLVVMPPGLFSILQGNDDRQAALWFAVLTIFNAFTALSMAQRGLIEWIPA